MVANFYKCSEGITYSVQLRIFLNPAIWIILSIIGCIRSTTSFSNILYETLNEDTGLKSAASLPFFPGLSKAITFDLLNYLGI